MTMMIYDLYNELIIVLEVLNEFLYKYLDGWLNRFYYKSLMDD